MASRFTDVAIEALRPHGARYIVFEPGSTGLAVRVGLRGSKTWVWRYRTTGGVHRRMILGRYPDMKLGEARVALEEARSTVRAGGDPVGEQRARKVAGAAAETVADLCQLYLDRHANVKKRARPAAEDKRLLNKEVLPALGKRKLEELKRRELVELIASMHARFLADGGSGGGANKLVVLLARMFKLAVRWGLIETSPALFLEKPAPAVIRDRCLSSNEVVVLWRGLDTATKEWTRRRALEASGVVANSAGIEEPSLSPRLATMLKLALVTAQRAGEIAQMRRDQLDLRKGVWTIPAAVAKNHRAHAVPLSGLALDLIGAALADNPTKDATDAIAKGVVTEAASDATEWVFPTHRNGAQVPHTRRDSLNHGLQQTKHFGLRHFSPHDLRRTAATGMARAGVARLIVSARAQPCLGTGPIGNRDGPLRSLRVPRGEARGAGDMGGRAGANARAWPTGRSGAPPCLER